MRNTGDRDGSDVVQVYGRRVGGDGRPRLLGFGRVDVPAGGTSEVIVPITPHALAERDVDAHATVVRTGTWELRVARSSTDPGIPLKLEVS